MKLSSFVAVYALCELDTRVSLFIFVGVKITLDQVILFVTVDELCARVISQWFTLLDISRG